MVTAILTLLARSAKRIQAPKGLHDNRTTQITGQQVVR